MSPRTGRPIIGERKDVDIKVRISQRENQRLTAYCDKHNIKRAVAIREAIVEKLDKEEEQNAASKQ